MYYIIYLLGIVFYFVKGIGIHKIFPGFIDYVTLVFILFPCFFILFCTKSFKSFGRAFLFAFGKRDASLTQYRESLASVKMTAVTAVVFGILCCMIGMINSVTFCSLSSFDDIYWILRDAGVALLSPFYSLLVCMILLPVYFLLKQHIIVQESAADKEH